MNISKMLSVSLRDFGKIQASIISLKLGYLKKISGCYFIIFAGVSFSFAALEMSTFLAG